MRGHSPSLVFWMVSFRIIEARKANINCLLPKSVQFHLANFSNALWSLLFNDLLYFCPQLHTKLMLPKIHHRNCRFKASNIFFQCESRFMETNDSPQNSKEREWTIIIPLSKFQVLKNIQTCKTCNYQAVNRWEFFKLREIA